MCYGTWSVDDEAAEAIRAQFGQSKRAAAVPRTWPFDVSPTSPAQTTRHVLELNYPVLVVERDRTTGVWKALCGTTTDPSDLETVGLDHLYNIDPTIGDLAALPAGGRARRASPGAGWVIEPDTEGGWG
jgi:hypothetical protein